MKKKLSSDPLSTMQSASKMINRFAPHFSFDEFTHSRIGNVHCIDNTLPVEYYRRAFGLLIILEDLRSVLKVPIYINSGYRCSELNSLVKGVSNSRHLLSCAVDITFPDFPSVCVEAVSHLFRFHPRFLKVYPDRHFIHVDFPPSYLESLTLLYI